MPAWRIVSETFSFWHKIDLFLQPAKSDEGVLTLKALQMFKTSSEDSLLPSPQVDLSLFSPVCIPPTSVASSEEFAGQNATAVGWGALEYGSKPLSTFFFPAKNRRP